MNIERTVLPSDSSGERILVVGGGMAGLSAAIEVAETGCQVVLVERRAYLGGRVAQMHQYFPKLCPPLCGLELNLRQIRNNRRIECIVEGEVEQIVDVGERLYAKIRVRARRVDGRCSACGKCEQVCPASRASEVDFGMTTTPAIHLPHPSAFPNRYVIDDSTCLGQSCGRCVAVCPQGAIDLSAKATCRMLDVNGVIWATGWQPYEASLLEGMGFGEHPDVITNMMMERLASPQGPTGGRIICPSDGRKPGRVAFVQCAGSRDDAHLKYCSALCCMASAKQVRYLHDAYSDVEAYVFYIDRRASGTQELFLAETEQGDKTHYVHGKVAQVKLDGGAPVVVFEDITAGRRSELRVDLVVLATGMVPAVRDAGASERLAADPYGFLARQQPRRAQIAVGCATEPMDVASSVRDGTAAALRALQWCHQRGSERVDSSQRRDE